MPKNSFQLLLTAKLQRFEVGDIGKCTKVLCTFWIDNLGARPDANITRSAKNPARLQNRPKTNDFVDELQNMISPSILGAGGWNFYLFRISDNIFIFWPFPVPIIRRCSPIIYPPGWPSCPARSSKSRKSWILLADFIFWVSQRLLGVGRFAWGLLKCLFLHSL